MMMMMIFHIRRGFKNYTYPRLYTGTTEELETWSRCSRLFMGFGYRPYYDQESRRCTSRPTTPEATTKNSNN